jgi:hypothetical protein
MASYRMLRRVALVRTDVSEEPSVSIIRVTRIVELGTTLAVTSKLHSFLDLVIRHSYQGCIKSIDKILIKRE